MIGLTVTDREFSILVYALNRLQADESANHEMQEDAIKILDSWNWRVLADEEE